MESVFQTIPMNIYLRKKSQQTLKNYDEVAINTFRRDNLKDD